MAQHYSDPQRESDPHALPDIEAFTAQTVEAICKKGCVHTYPEAPEECVSCGSDIEDEKQTGKVEWYYWFCFPGCLPDGDPVGPFASEAEALADAREGMEE